MSSMSSRHGAGTRPDKAVSDRGARWSADAEDGFGMAVGIDVVARTRGALAASIGGNAELLVPAPSRRGSTARSSEAALGDLLRDLRARAEKPLARP